MSTQKWWLLAVVVAALLTVSPADADQLGGGYFNNGTAPATSDEESNHEDLEPAAPLTIPTNTPVPLEGYRWKSRHVRIFLETDDPHLRAAFRRAVKNWNAVGAVRLTWTKHRRRAQVIATSADLTDQSDNGPYGQQVSQLGSTSTSYDPDTHAMLHARSTLDPAMLDASSLAFRTEVAEHELGHALGLAHAREYQHSVMIPRNVRGGITAADRTTLRALYHRRGN